MSEQQQDPTAKAPESGEPDEVKVAVDLGGATVAPQQTQAFGRTFRDAWMLDGEAVVIDMPRARDIHRDALRRDRAALFAPYDDTLRTLSRKALLTGLSDEDRAKAAAAEAACQVLRDITADPRIEAAGTPEQLEALTLGILISSEGSNR